MPEGMTGEFSNGFVERAFLRAKDLATTGAAMARVTPLRELYLEARDPGELDAVPEIPWLANVQQVSVNVPWNVSLGSVQRFLRRLPRLRELGVDAYSATCVIDPALPPLRVLWFSSGGQWDPHAAEIAQTPHLASLESLSFASAPMGPDGARSIAGARCASSLRRLALHHAKIGPDGVSALIARDWPALRVLDLQWTMIGETGAADLAAALPKRFPALEELALSEVSRGFLRALAHPSLRVLQLRSALLGDDGAARLAAAALPALRVLDLTGNGIGSKGLEALAASAWASSLRELRLGHNSIGARGVTELANTPLGRLGTLTLEGTGTSANDVRQILENPTLTRLRALGVDSPGVAALMCMVDHGRPVLRELTAESVDDTHVYALAGCAAAAGVCRLRLRGLSCTVLAARALASSPHLSGLGMLILEKPRLDAAALRALEIGFGRRLKVSA
jgi:hypothetical protein